MALLTYIHAADLHLDAAFIGISNEAQTKDLGERLCHATFTALDNLVALCLQEKPHFLVLAGDIYNAKDQSLKAQLALRDACQTLDQHNIMVYIVHGNHDPLSSRLQMLTWPKNVHTFGEHTESKIFEHQGQALAVIHGISYIQQCEERNLAKTFTRLQEYKHLFQLGLLHCTLEGSPHSERYAPCTLADLHNTQLDAFALGHVHEKRILQEQHPLVLYSGNTQGLHINEEGPRGCYRITVNEQAQGKFHTEHTFHPLGPVQWQKCTVHIEGVEQFDIVMQYVLEHIEHLKNTLPALCTGLIIRLIFTGHTSLDSPLRNIQQGTEFLQNLRDHIQNSHHIHPTSNNEILISIKDMRIETSPVLNFETLREQDDLLGETLRFAQTLQQDPATADDFVRNALAPLYMHTKAKNILSSTLFDNPQEIQEMLKDAERLCADSMEVR